MKEEKEARARIAREATKRDIKYKDYDGAMMSALVGRKSIVRGTQSRDDNASDYCVFYYDPQYQPPKRKHSNRDICKNQPKSGTMLAYEYAYTRKRTEYPIEIINIWRCNGFILQMKICSKGIDKILKIEYNKNTTT